MRALLTAVVVVVCIAAASSAQATAKPGTEFDGTYRLTLERFPSIKAHCNAFNGQPAMDLPTPLPTRPITVHVLGGVYAGHRIAPSLNGSMGLVTFSRTSGGVTFAYTVNFSAVSRHSMHVATRVSGSPIPGCKPGFSGGYGQFGYRIGP
jgi:opacity protein-like surface antigen